MKAINGFGPFETAPKKGYVSLRGKKQFAMIGPATNTRVDVGLNMKGVKGDARASRNRNRAGCASTRSRSRARPRSTGS